MAGTFPIQGDLSMEDLAGRLTKHEALSFVELTALVKDGDAIKKRNLATFVDQVNQLGRLVIVDRDARGVGRKILSANVYVSGTAKDVDVYRMPSPW